MRSQHIYFLGLDHPTMTGMAVATKQLGFAVSGVGRSIDPILAQQLAEAGVHHYQSYQAQHIDPDCLMVVGPHLTRQNVELKMAQRMNIDIISLAQLVQQISQHQHQLVVINSAATAALIANILQQPSLAADLVCSQLASPTDQWPEPSAVHFAAKPWLVVDSQWQPASTLDKATEWLYYQPNILIALQPPHFKPGPSYYRDLQHLIDHLKPAQAKKTVAVIMDTDHRLLSMLKQAKLAYITFGQSTSADIRATDITYSTHQTSFDLHLPSHQKQHISIQQVGLQGLYQSLAAIAASSALETPLSDILLRLGNSNGLYYDHLLLHSLNDIRLVELALPWPQDTSMLLTRLKQQYLADDSAKLWLVVEDRHYVSLINSPITTETLLADVIINLQDGLEVAPSSRLPKKPISDVTYHLPVEQACHFIAQHAAPGDLICHLHDQWQTNQYLDQLASAIRGVWGTD